MAGLEKIAKNKLKNVATGEIVPMGSIWEDQASVIIFFRRWGCLLCRLWAKEVSAISETLKEHNVRLVGVGFDYHGVQDFAEGKFFKGELYTDISRKTYVDLGFKRFNFFTIIASLFTRKSRTAISKARRLNLPSNFRGDGLQNGGAIVVDKGGKLLYEFKQEGPADRVRSSEILELLDIPVEDGIDDKVGV